MLHVYVRKRREWEREKAKKKGNREGRVWNWQHATNVDFWFPLLLCARQFPQKCVSIGNKSTLDSTPFPKLEKKMYIYILYLRIGEKKNNKRKRIGLNKKKTSALSFFIFYLFSECVWAHTHLYILQYRCVQAIWQKRYCVLLCRARALCIKCTYI